MTALLIVLGVLALAYHLGGVELERYEMRARYRTAHLGPYAHQCVDCGSGYSDQRALVWHRQAAHPNTFDFGGAPNAVHRRSNAGRDSAGEILDGEDARELGSRPWPHETKARRHLFPRSKS